MLGLLRPARPEYPLRMASDASAFDPKRDLSRLPRRPGVYRMLGEGGEVLYVGKARDLKKRVSSYFQKNDLSPRIRLMVAAIRDLQITVTRSESEALLLENNLIKGLKPKYNILFRDDKSYPYLLLTGHEFPRLSYFRGTPSKADRAFGPYPNAHAVRESIQILQKVFRLRTCEDSVFKHRSRPCLLHQIGRCSAPCVGAVSREDYRRDVEQAALFLSGKDDELIATLSAQMERLAAELRYEEAAVVRDRIQALNRVREKQFVESRSRQDADVIGLAMAGSQACVYLLMIRAGRNLGGRAYFPSNADGMGASEVLEAFISQHYAERAAPATLVLPEMPEGLAKALVNAQGDAVKLLVPASGERRNWLKMAEQNAALALSSREGERTSQARRLAALNQYLNETGIARIECFDVSHTQGEATVVACVVFDHGGMQNSEYRRYNITLPTPGDDYYALREALTRRYGKLVAGEGRLPDLVLIDGGRGQLNVALDVLRSLGLAGLPVIGVAKGERRKAGEEQLFFPDEANPRRLPPTDPALHLIQYIRDEAHRFALTGHRTQRGKKRVASRLEDIPGIGPRRRQALLKLFGGLRGVQSAGIEELAQAEGISRELAERIYQALH